MDVLTLCETKMKGKSDCEFGCVKGRKQVVVKGKEGVAMLVSEKVNIKLNLVQQMLRLWLKILRKEW